MLYLLFAAIIVAGDQFFKYWIVQHVQLGGQIPLIPGVIHLTYLQNTGAAFSILENMRWLLAALAAVCAILLVIYLFKTRVGVLGKIGIAAVIGGAVGNVIDRIRLGYVVDMFEVEFMDYAVFNIADCLIVVGGILFCICYIVWSAKEDKRKKARKKRREEARFDGPMEAEASFDLRPEGKGEDWTETEILESYDLERLLSEERENDGDHQS